MVDPSWVTWKVDSLPPQEVSDQLVYTMTGGIVQDPVLRDDTLYVSVIPTETKLGEFVILEFKRMSDVTDQYVTWTKRVTENQYVFIISSLNNTIRPQGWLVKQVNFRRTLVTRTGLIPELRILQGPTCRNRVHSFEIGLEDIRRMYEYNETCTVRDSMVDPSWA